MNFRRSLNFLFSIWLKSILEKSTYVYLSILRIKHFRKRVETKISKPYYDLIIDGYPRSANSYTTRLFQHLEPRFLIGNHLHSVAHIIYGIKKSIPTIVLIRNPKDAVISFAALVIIEKYSGNKNLFLKRNSIKWMVNRYIHFYTPLIEHSDKILLIDFDLITNNVLNVIEIINRKWNLNLETDAKIIDYYNSLIFKRARSHLKPSYNRNQIKKDLTYDIKTDNDLSNSFVYANELYNKLLNSQNTILNYDNTINNNNN